MHDDICIPTALPDMIPSGASFSGMRDVFSGSRLAATPAELVILRNHITELLNEVEHLRTERDQLAMNERRLSELLDTTPDRLAHDVRNLLNERSLLRALADIATEPT